MSILTSLPKLFSNVSLHQYHGRVYQNTECRPGPEFLIWSPRMGLEKSVLVRHSLLICMLLVGWERGWEHTLKTPGLKQNKRKRVFSG